MTSDGHYVPRGTSVVLTQTSPFQKGFLALLIGSKDCRAMCRYSMSMSCLIPIRCVCVSATSSEWSRSCCRRSNLTMPCGKACTVVRRNTSSVVRLCACNNVVITRALVRLIETTTQLLLFLVHMPCDQDHHREYVTVVVCIRVPPCRQHVKCRSRRAYMADMR